MSAGGSVLWLIAILAAFMWAIILERIWYFNAGHQVYMGELKLNGIQFPTIPLGKAQQ